MSTSIAQAASFIEELLNGIENAYWECSAVETKNLCFNAVRLLQVELTEVTKLSVQDLHHEYEVITYRDNTVIDTLTQLEHVLKSTVLRTQTQNRLKPLLMESVRVFART